MLRSIALLLCISGGVVVAQEPATAPSTSMNVYLDCQDFGACDFDFFRTELAMVNWVRDRQLADLHILVTTQSTGAGGREFTITFMGLRQFSGITDTLTYVAPPASTQDEQRRGLARVFRLGLVRYFARTPAGERLTIAFGEQKQQSGQVTSKRDRWKSWVFRGGVNGFTYGEQRFKDYNIRWNANADRITETWKTRLSYSNSVAVTQQVYPVCDAGVCRDTTDKYRRTSRNGSVLQVRSVSQHLSAGLRVGTLASTYENFDNVIRVFPALEYNVFPYSQSTRRQLRLEYNVGYGYYSYNEVTLYDKLRESMPIQRLLLGVATRETWGSIDVGANATHYLNENRNYRVGGFGEVSLRLFRGFELNAWGEYNTIRDQFNLPKRLFSPEEILTRRFQLGTRYRYYGSVGLSYTFGSIYNNVVNPRMTSGAF